MKITCKKCGSNDVALSRRRGEEKLIQYILPLAPYRCRACMKRFWVLKKTYPSLPVIITIGGLLLFFGLPLLCNKAPGTSGINTQKHNTTHIVQKITRENTTDKIDESEEIAQSDQVEDKMNSQIDAGETSVHSISSKGVNYSEQSAGDKLAALTSSTDAPDIRAIERSESVRLTEKDSLLRELKALTFMEKDKGLELMVIADEPIEKYKYFFLENPKRLVIDLPGRWKKSKITLPKVTGNIIRRVRLGYHLDKYRIACDIINPSSVSPTFIKLPEGLKIILQ